MGSTWTQMCTYTFVLADFTVVMLHCKHVPLSENRGLCDICSCGPHTLYPWEIGAAVGHT